MNSPRLVWPLQAHSMLLERKGARLLILRHLASWVTWDCSVNATPSCPYPFSSFAPTLVLLSPIHMP